MPLQLGSSADLTGGLQVAANPLKLRGWSEQKRCNRWMDLTYGLFSFPFSAKDIGLVLEFKTSLSSSYSQSNLHEVFTPPHCDMCSKMKRGLTYVPA